MTQRDDKPWGRAPRRGEPDIWDYVVVGSGMGGMTAAALLARLGRRVLVLEQHYVPGGFTHTFKRPGYRWDVGVHAVGEVTQKTITGRLLHRLTDGRLQWASLGKVYDAFHWRDGFHIDFPDTPDQFRHNLLEAFPAERQAIDAYLRLVRDVAGTMRGYYLSRLAPPAMARVGDLVLARPAQKWFDATVHDVVWGLTQDERLRGVMVAQWGYYGSVPRRASFAMQALVVRHFTWGAYYPVGGSRRIADALLRTVADAGGWTRIAAGVAEIVVEDGRATGVRLGSGELVRAHKVISAAGAVPTVRKLLPPEVRAAEWAKSIAALRPGPAHVCLYLGFKGDIRKAGASAANQWFYETWDAAIDAWHIEHEPAGPAPVLYCSFPSLKDPEHDPGPEQRHTGEVVTFVPWDYFATWREQQWRKRGPDYEEIKRQLTETMLEQFFANMPGLRPMLAFAELSTPVTTDHFCRPASGSIYGLEPVPARYRNPWLRPRTPVRDLFLAGCDVGSVGVVGAMLGGVLCAAAAEPVAALRYVRSS